MRDLRKARTYLQGTTHFSDIRLLEVCAIVLFFVFFCITSKWDSLNSTLAGWKGGSEEALPSFHRARDTGSTGRFYVTSSSRTCSGKSTPTLRPLISFSLYLLQYPCGVYPQRTGSRLASPDSLYTTCVPAFALVFWIACLPPPVFFIRSCTKIACRFLLKKVFFFHWRKSIFSYHSDIVQKPIKIKIKKKVYANGAYLFLHTR